MKTLFVCTVVFLFIGIGSVAAQDLIVLRNGNTIEAKVEEVSSTEIRYKRFDNLDGPTIVVPVTDVLTIRYENGTSETFNAVTASAQENASAETPRTTAMNPDKLTVGINVNPAGLLAYGGSISFEFGMGNFSNELNLIIPFGLAGGSGAGFGISTMFNYVWHSRLGGFYLGGGFGFIWKKDAHTIYENRNRPWLTEYTHHWDSAVYTAGLNLGYKFVMPSGLYFRTGAYVGVGMDFSIMNLNGMDAFDTPDPYSFYWKPELSVGYSFQKKR